MAQDPTEFDRLVTSFCRLYKKGDARTEALRKHCCSIKCAVPKLNEEISTLIYTFSKRVTFSRADVTENLALALKHRNPSYLVPFQFSSFEEYKVLTLGNPSIVLERDTLLSPSTRQMLQRMDEDFASRFLDIVTCWMLDAFKASLDDFPAGYSAQIILNRTDFEIFDFQLSSAVVESSLNILKASLKFEVELGVENLSVEDELKLLELLPDLALDHLYLSRHNSESLEHLLSQLNAKRARIQRLTIPNLHTLASSQHTELFKSIAGKVKFCVPWIEKFPLLRETLQNYDLFVSTESQDLTIHDFVTIEDLELSEMSKKSSIDYYSFARKSPKANITPSSDAFFSRTPSH